MFCSECGKKINDDMKFCPYCGTKVVSLEQPLQQQMPVQQEPAPVQQQPAPVQQQPAPVQQQPAPVQQQPAPVEQAPRTAGKKKTGPVIGIIVAIIAVVVIVAIVTNKKNDDMRAGSDSGNLLENGDFSHGDREWTFSEDNNGSADMKVEDGELVVKVSNSGTHPWDVQASYDNIKLKAGHTYKLSYSVRQTGNDAGVVVQIIQNSGRREAFVNSAFDVEKDMQTIENTFTVNNEQKEDFSLVVYMGDNSSNGLPEHNGGYTFYLDDFVLEDLGTDGASNVTEEKKTTEEKTTEAKTTEATTEAKTTEATTEAPSVSHAQIITDILLTIEGYPNYKASQSMQPLAVCADVDKDGNLELLAVYECTDFVVRYDLWYITDTGADKLVSGDLYKEVGGNSGSIGIAKKGGKTYFVRRVNQPEGDRFFNFTEFHPFDETGGGPTDAGTVIFESNGIYGEEESGSYTIDGSSVGLSTYNSEYDSYGWEYKLNYNSGAVDGAMTFDDLIQSAAFIE